VIGFVSVGLLALLALSIPVGIVLFLLGFGVDQLLHPFPLSRALGKLCGRPPTARR
jgi:C4-dicarboxylate transporter DctM subunit